MMSNCSKCKHYKEVNFESVVGDICLKRNDLPRFFKYTDEVADCKYYEYGLFRNFDTNTSIFIVAALGLVTWFLFMVQ